MKIDFYLSFIYLMGANSRFLSFTGLKAQSDSSLVAVIIYQSMLMSLGLVINRLLCNYLNCSLMTAMMLWSKNN